MDRLPCPSGPPANFDYLDFEGTRQLPTSACRLPRRWLLVAKGCPSQCDSLRDHLWQGPSLPVTLRSIHPPPKMTQGVMTPLTPLHHSAQGREHRFLIDRPSPSLDRIYQLGLWLAIFFAIFHRIGSNGYFDRAQTGHQSHAAVHSQCR